MTERDDALLRELGWTAASEPGAEPETGPEVIPGWPETDPVGEPPTAHRPAPGPGPAPLTGAEASPQFRDPERPRSSFREPAAQYVSPPHVAPPPQPYPPPQAGQHAPRHAPPPPAPRPEGGPWGPPPAWQPAPAPRPVPPPAPGQPIPGGPIGQPMPPGTYGAGGGAPAPGSYAERIRATDLVPARKTPPASGWRRFLFRASFGLINAGPSADELRQADLEAKIRSVLRGHYKVGVMGKGGVGKTTVSASVGSVFAELRQDDRVVAVDADTAFGKLGSRVDPQAQGSYWELASDRHLDTFADVRSRVGHNAAGLFVLAGEATPARRRVLDPAIYREATARLDRHFTISIVDCSSTMDSPVTQEVLRDLDALLVVSSPWVDGAAAAGQTMDWLANRGMSGLLQRTVVVLNDSDGHADKKTKGILAQQFAGQGQIVVEVPFDANLRPGGVIDTTETMSPQTRRRFLEIAAALAEHFPAHDDRALDRR